MTDEDHDEADAHRAAVALEMKAIKPECEYYALTLTANRRNHLCWSKQTHWIGWSERREGWEIREASLVHPGNMTALWDRVGRPWVSVHDDRHMILFLQIGGNVLVEKSYADQWLPEVVAPYECVHDGDIRYGGGGFLSTGHLPDEAATRYAPTRKLRMQVIKRDNYRCVICGASPHKNVHVELEVHHVIPWRMGGPTAEEHLATLCGACHDGLDPDYEPKIRELAKLPAPANPLNFHDEFHEEVRRYRELVSEFWPGLF